MEGAHIWCQPTYMVPACTCCLYLLSRCRRSYFMLGHVPSALSAFVESCLFPELVTLPLFQFSTPSNKICFYFKALFLLKFSKGMWQTERPRQDLWLTFLSCKEQFLASAWAQGFPRNQVVGINFQPGRTSGYQVQFGCPVDLVGFNVNAKMVHCKLYQI